MDAYTQGLQTISNNVANLNSTGYKQTIQSFGNLVDNSGSSYLGSGASRDTGAGVHISSTLTDFSQGTLTTTNNDLDLGIQGTGFLTVLTKDGQVLYTRTGSFAVDKDGYISDQTTGDRLAVIDANGHPQAVNLNNKQVSQAVTTSKITFTQNLSSSAQSANVSNVTITDADGNQEVLSVDFEKSTASNQANQWTATFKDAGGLPVGDPITLNFIGESIDDVSSSGTLLFTPNGSTTPLSIDLDFSAVTSQSATTGSDSTIAATADGNIKGTLSSTTIDDTGQVLLTYTNGQTVQEGAVAIANFENPQVLTKLNNGLYRNDSGTAPGLFASTKGGVGTLTPKSLESSNVDLSAEFGDLILLQRGFQACSEVISVSNDMIQQLFSIRGQ
jgi:flagellar hook protein FlgE